MKANEKHRARDAAKALRIKLAKAGKSTAAQGLRDNILSCLGGFGVLPPAVVAGYCPVGGEIDPLAAMQGLVARGFRLALPVIEDDDAPLAFRQWEANAALRVGRRGILIPMDAAPPARPALILAPMLAFDAEGYRLGWGGGYYDRTIAALRTGGDPVVVVGVAYEGQRLAATPRDRHDEPLDWIVTEETATRIERRTGG